jgi:hypothetical protein
MKHTGQWALNSTTGALALTFGLRAYDSLQRVSAQRAHGHAGNALAFLPHNRSPHIAGQMKHGL